MKVTRLLLLFAAILLLVPLMVVQVQAQPIQDLEDDVVEIVADEEECSPTDSDACGGGGPTNGWGDDPTKYPEIFRDDMAGRQACYEQSQDPECF